MTIGTILYITLALLIALGFAYYQYLYKKKSHLRNNYIFFALRALAVFLVLLLFVNPKIRTRNYTIEKPELILLSDNSRSISYLEQEEQLKDLIQNLKSDKGLNQRFKINTLYFGNNLSLKDTLNFGDSGTDIYNALSETENLFHNDEKVIVVLTDGNQSQGRDFRYFKARENTEIVPLVLGDTTTYQDLSIDRINSNRYAFLKNRFPIEVFLSYSGEELTEESKFNIKSGDQIIYSQEISFSEEVKSKIINFTLPANSLGVKTYKAEITPLNDEKNTQNNYQNFGVEVIDERTSVLLLTDLIHPDLGAIKKSVESNQQRSLNIKNINEENIQISKYQLIILYQLNRKFQDVISEITSNKSSLLFITGTKTDWTYLNSLNLEFSKNATGQSQEIFPVYDKTFSAFQFEDIGFDDFPPLEDKFGEVAFTQNLFDVMLQQEIQGVETGEPLLAISENQPKIGFLLGENIWRWRAKSYLDNKTFEEFDNFFGKVIQNLTSRRNRDRLTIDYENFYYGNQKVIVAAQFFDENYQFDAGADLKITITNSESNDSFTSDLLIKNNFYVFEVGDLAPGNYNFNVNAENTSLSRSGSFQVIEYNTERQFVSANKSGMASFASYNNTRLFYPDKVDSLKYDLLNNDRFKPVQKSSEKTVPLIDWYYLLLILIIILAAEWFYRKYLGLI